MQAKEHWKGEGGDQYIDRQDEAELLYVYEEMWGQIFQEMDEIPARVLELGASVGINLDALRLLQPNIECLAIEPNEKARKVLRQKGYEIRDPGIAELKYMDPVDLSFSRGVLIHIPPTELAVAYETLYRASRKYIVVAEYFNPTPVEIEYRGQKGLLWKRDFAGEMMERFPDLKLVEYGFIYDKDPIAPQDNITWFLLEKVVP